MVGYSYERTFGDKKERKSGIEQSPYWVEWQASWPPGYSPNMVMATADGQILADGGVWVPNRGKATVTVSVDGQVVKNSRADQDMAVVSCDF